MEVNIKLYRDSCDWNLADLQRSLGDIPAYRVRVHPPLGWATKEDVVRLEAQEGILCELEYGVLVEKPGGGTNRYWLP